MEKLDSAIQEPDSEMKRLDLKIQTAVKSAKIFAWALPSGKVPGKWDIRYLSEKYYVMRVKVLKGTYMQGENKYIKIYSMLKK